MPASHDKLLPAEVEARVRELLAQGQRRKAIRLISAHAAICLSEVDDIADILISQPEPGPRTREPGLEQPGNVPADLTAEFALTLRHAKRMAGDPSYDYLAKHACCSVPTISRVFAGRALPRWDIVKAILAVMGVPPGRIDTEWRNLWVQALDQRKPLRQPDGTPYLNPAPASPHPTPAPAPELETPPRPEPEQERAGHRICDDCGALIGDLAQHQAWHWRIDRQLRKSTMRVIDATA